jgi:UbiD family decarboxylase
MQSSSHNRRKRNVTKSWSNLREYVQALDKAGKLVRITTPVNKDTQLHPLVRLQFRGLAENDRKAFLFENVVDSRGHHYEIPVLVGAMAGSADIYALGMGCAVEEIHDKWGHALANPIAPIVVDTAPCQDICISDKQIAENGEGLGRLPIPISTPGFDNAPYTTASNWVSRHPETGLHNLGNYRGMVKAENRLGTFPSALGIGMRLHLDLWREKKVDRMPAAVVIGAPPHVVYTAVTRVPNDVCEYDVAGGLSGKPLELVRCLTQDIYVPAQSEIVIEGTIPTDLLEIEGAFGEFPGYMANRDYSFFMDITCITMRRNPIYLAILSQLPPSESSKMRHIGRVAAAKKMLQDSGFNNVVDINYLECTGSNPTVVVKLKKEKPDDGIKVLQALAKKFIGKVAIAVDEDIDIYNLESVMWAIAFRAQPYRDVEIIDVPLFSLDPSLTPPHHARGLVNTENVPRSSGLLIDATMPWPYPPLSLPKREYMEAAIAMWEDLQLPPLNLKDPWYGRSLGHWTEEEEHEADLAVAGRYYETGEKLRARRRTFST